MNLYDKTPTSPALGTHEEIGQKSIFKLNIDTHLLNAICIKEQINIPWAFHTLTIPTFCFTIASAWEHNWISRGILPRGSGIIESIRSTANKHATVIPTGEGSVPKARMLVRAIGVWIKCCVTACSLTA